MMVSTAPPWKDVVTVGVVILANELNILRRGNRVAASNSPASGRGDV